MIDLLFKLCLTEFAFDLGLKNSSLKENMSVRFVTNLYGF